MKILILLLAVSSRCKKLIQSNQWLILCIKIHRSTIGPWWNYLNASVIIFSGISNAATGLEDFENTAGVTMWLLPIVSRVDVGAGRSLSISEYFEIKVIIQYGWVSAFYITVVDLSHPIYCLFFQWYNKTLTDWIFVE